MATSPRNSSSVPTLAQNSLSFIAFVLGCFGLVFYQIASFGVILGFAGLCFGVAAWFTASARGGAGAGFAIASTLLCVLALAVDILIFTYGLASFVRPP